MLTINTGTDGQFSKAEPLATERSRKPKHRQSRLKARNSEEFCQVFEADF